MIIGLCSFFSYCFCKYGFIRILFLINIGFLVKGFWKNVLIFKYLFLWFMKVENKSKRILYNLILSLLDEEVLVEDGFIFVCYKIWVDFDWVFVIGMFNKFFFLY